MASIYNRLQSLENLKKQTSSPPFRKLSPNLEARITALLSGDISPDDPNNKEPWKFWTLEDCMKFLIEGMKQLIDQQFSYDHLENFDAQKAYEAIEEYRQCMVKILDPWLDYLEVERPGWWDKGWPEASNQLG